MKRLNLIIITLLLSFVVGCEDDDRDLDYLDDITAPSNVDVAFRVSDNNTGLVTINPSATGAAAFTIDYGDGTAIDSITVGETIVKIYQEGTYDVVLTAVALNGLTTELQRELVVAFIPPQNLEVTIENTNVSNTVRVNATADFGIFYEVDFGDESEIQSANMGEEIVYEYAASGFYDITISAFSAASEPTVFVEENFEVTEIAPPPSGNELLVNGDFEAGADPWIVGVDDNSPAPVVTVDDNTFYSVDVTSAGNAFDVNLSQKLEILEGETYTLTFDAWSDVDRSIIAGIGLSGGSFANTNETVNISTAVTTFTLTLTADGFGAPDARVLFDVGAEVGQVNIDNVSLKIVGENLLVNGDFEAGADPWIVGVDDNSPAPVVTVDGNTYYSVDVTTAGNAFDVNLSQKLEIFEGSTYTLTFDAWSNVDRSIIAGIGLSGGSFANTNETVNISTAITTFTLTLPADGFGAPDARVLFDVGAEVGVVNIDNVSLVLN